MVDNFYQTTPLVVENFSG